MKAFVVEDFKKVNPKGLRMPNLKAKCNNLSAVCLCPKNLYLKFSVDASTLMYIDEIISINQSKFQHVCFLVENAANS